MELDTLIAWPFDSVHPECWAKQARRRCQAVLRWFAQRQQERIGQEDQLTAWTQKTPGLGDPALRICPQTGAVLGNGKIEGRICEWRPLCVAMDKGKVETVFKLKTPGGSQLCQRVVDADRT
jgi:hypothetical protein